MKRLLALAFVLVVVISLCGCGGSSLDRACNKADKVIEKFDKESINKYESEFLMNVDSTTDVYAVYVTIYSYDDLTDSAKEYETVQNSGKIYSEISGVFAKNGVTDVTIAVICYDEYGNAVYGEINGHPVN